MRFLYSTCYFVLSPMFKHAHMATRGLVPQHGPQLFAVVLTMLRCFNQGRRAALAIGIVTPHVARLVLASGSCYRAWPHVFESGEFTVLNVWRPTLSVWEAIHKDTIPTGDWGGGDERPYTVLWNYCGRYAPALYLTSRSPPFCCQGTIFLAFGCHLQRAGITALAIGIILPKLCPFLSTRLLADLRGCWCW